MAQPLATTASGSAKTENGEGGAAPQPSTAEKSSPTAIPQATDRKARRQLPPLESHVASQPIQDARLSPESEHRQERSTSLSSLRGDGSSQPSPQSPHMGRRLRPPSDDMERRRLIQDLMTRQCLKFTLEEAAAVASRGEKIPEGDVYAVYTPQAIRPWDGPHAHRAETHVVLILSDVYGWESEYTRCVADQVAELCDVIVLVPDMFRGRPWDETRPAEEYEEWRASHDPVGCSRGLCSALPCTTLSTPSARTRM